MLGVPKELPEIGDADLHVECEADVVALALSRTLDRLRHARLEEELFSTDPASALRRMLYFFRFNSTDGKSWCLRGHWM